MQENRAADAPIRHLLLIFHLLQTELMHLEECGTCSWLNFRRPGEMGSCLALLVERIVDVRHEEKPVGENILQYMEEFLKTIISYFSGTAIFSKYRGSGGLVL